MQGLRDVALGQLRMQRANLLAKLCMSGASTPPAPTAAARGGHAAMAAKAPDWSPDRWQRQHRVANHAWQSGLRESCDTSQTRLAMTAALCNTSSRCASA